MAWPVIIPIFSVSTFIHAMAGRSHSCSKDSAFSLELRKRDSIQE